METLRTTFNNLVTSMKRYDLYQIDDEVGMGVQKLSDKIDELYKRMECVIKTNKDCKGIISIYEDVISFDDFEILERSTNDIDIAMDLTDDEAITNDWYGLFAPNDEEEIVPRETLEPPTYQSSEPETFDKVKLVIETLKTLHNGDCVDGETMQYILERIGMTDQMLRQLIMSNSESDTKDLLEEKRILSNRGELYK